MKKILGMLLVMVMTLAGCNNDDPIYTYSYTDHQGEEYESCSPVNLDKLNTLSELMEERTSYTLLFKGVDQVRHRVEAIVRRYDEQNVVLFFKKNQKFEGKKYYCLLNKMRRRDGKGSDDSRDKIKENLVVMDIANGAPVSIASSEQRALYPSMTGAGTEKDPILIKTRNDLNNMNSGLNHDASKAEGMFFKQTADIKVDKYNDTVSGWTPLGFDTHGNHGFRGNYDGNNFKLLNLAIHNDMETADGGFFAVLLPGAHVKNVTLESPGVHMKNSTNVGALCGRSEGAVIERVAVTHPAIEGYAHVGGLVGYVSDYCMMEDVTVEGVSEVHGAASEGTGFGGVIGAVNENSTIKLKRVEAEVYVRGGNDVGGVIGSAVGTLELDSVYNKCYLVEGSGSNVGGVIGRLDGSINMSHSKSTVNNISTEIDTKTITGQGNVGGAIGRMNLKASSDISDFLVAGHFSSTGNNFGGMIGTIEGMDLELKNVTVSQSGSLTASGVNNVGGVIGYVNAAVTLSSDAGKPESGKTNLMSISVSGGKNIGGIIGLAEKDVKMSNIGNKGNVNGSEAVGGLIGKVYKCTATFSNSGSPYVKDTCSNSGINIVATSMNVGGLVGHAESGRVSVVTDGYSVFGGSVNSVDKEPSVDNNGGVVGYLEHSSFKGDNFKVRGSVNGRNFVAGVVGYAKLTNSSCSIEINNVETTGDGINTGYKDVAGFVGRIEISNSGSASFSNSTNSHTVRGQTDSAAGFVASIDVSGDNRASTHFLNNCNNKGSIGEQEGDYLANHTGGFIGYISRYSGSYSLINNCVNYGYIQGRYNVAGLVATIAGRIYGNIYKAYNEGTIEGWSALTKDKEHVAGIVGFAYTAILSCCGNYGQIVSHSCEHTGGLVGRIGQEAIYDRDFCVSESFNVGLLNADSGYQGGLVASLGTCSNTSKEGLHNCYSITGYRTNDGLKSGAFMAWACSNIKVSNLFHFGEWQDGVIPDGWHDQLSERMGKIYMFRAQTGNDRYVTCLNPGDNKNQSKFSGFDFNNIWEMPEDAEHPILKNNREKTPYKKITIP